MNTVWIFLTCAVVHTLGTNVSSPYEVGTEMINSSSKYYEEHVIQPQITYRNENLPPDFEIREILEKAKEEISHEEDPSNSSHELFPDPEYTGITNENISFPQDSLNSYMEAFPESKEIMDEMFNEDPSNSSHKVRNSTFCSMLSIPCQDGACVHFSQFCDGQGDCSDGSDEDVDFCKAGVAVMVCSNGQVIRGHDVRCDGVDDCDDGSDEVACFLDNLDNDLSKVFLKPCNWLSHFQCNEGTCIDKSRVCDGVYDCPFGVDESSNQCALKNSIDNGNTFDSNTDGGKYEMLVCDDKQMLFIAKNALCNGIKDCDDGSDETNCEYYSCADGVKISTLQSNVRCDGIRSCPDGSDENDCEEEYINIPSKIGGIRTETVFIATTILLSVCLFVFFVIMIAQCRVNTYLRKMLRQAGNNQGDALTSVKTNPPPSYSEVVGQSNPSS